MIDKPTLKLYQVYVFVLLVYVIFLDIQQLVRLFVREIVSTERGK